MKKTNVMIEVSDDLYDAIVAPSKKKKSFGRLVVQLLEAYRDNESIYSYINGTLDDLENEATEELLKDLNSMANSLNMLSALENQAEANIDEGLRTFEDYTNKDAQVEEVKHLEMSSPQIHKDENQNSGLTKEDVVDIVEESISDIKDMLQQLLDNGVVNRDIASTVESTVKDSIYENIDKGTTDEKVVEDKHVEEVIVDTPVSKEDEEKAKNALDNLLGSISF